MKKIHRFSLSALATAISCYSGVVAAETFALEEIIVTAQKRAQNAQDIPMAVSAFDENALKAMDVKDAGSIISRTPGLSGGKDADSQNVLTIRGIGPIFGTFQTIKVVQTLPLEVPGKGRTVTL